ncbi:PREDICTED: uncharacterized protein LOC109209748 [Nicotiana attenuata]|uniref:uncharacterized protein LOC109209748 n=1 Tax=Nicotiana attenuata TaxID=49451 RepID=UPI0009056C7A|nr:PREDICTED: uncharacterized protein LOC109209748 [Nicotiana attenuata]
MPAICLSVAPNSMRIIVECDEFALPIGKSAGLLAGFLGHLATNPRYFSTGFKSCASMPKAFVDRAFNDFVMSQFFFTSDQQKVKGWFNNSLNKKWKEFRLTLWHEAEDPLLSKEDIIKNAPEGIPMDQWALYVNYRSKEEQRFFFFFFLFHYLSLLLLLLFSFPFFVSLLHLCHCCGFFFFPFFVLLNATGPLVAFSLCLRNQRIRGQQTLPHTSGATSLARRRALMKKQGKEVDRNKVWTETHKRKDGSYVNDQAREIGVSVDMITVVSFDRFIQFYYAISILIVAFTCLVRMREIGANGLSWTFGAWLGYGCLYIIA